MAINSLRGLNNEIMCKNCINATLLKPTEGHYKSECTESSTIIWRGNSLSQSYEIIQFFSNFIKL